MNAKIQIDLPILSWKYISKHCIEILCSSLDHLTFVQQKPGLSGPLYWHYKPLTWVEITFYQNKIKFVPSLDKWRNNEEKIFTIDKKIALHFLYYSECLYQPLSLLCNSYNQPCSYFKDLSQSCLRVGILANQRILILPNVPLVWNIFLMMWWCVKRL
jgi:hypothetical protein